MTQYNEKTGDIYELKMFLALLSNKENFMPNRGTAYWANNTHYSDEKVPLSIDGVRKYNNGFHKWTHVLWINK